VEKLVTIVMPCYNMGKYIQQALDSVGVQTYTKWEIIAVEDLGIKDGTEDIVLKFAKKHKYQSIQFITSTENRGVSAARNTAIKQAKGAFIALLDPDDYWASDHLEKAINHFNSDPELYFYSSFAYLLNHDSPLKSVGIEGYVDWEMKAFPYILSIRNAIPASSAVLRTKVFDSVQLFDEDKEIQHVEDYDLWVRILEKNLKISINPEPTIYYRKHASAATSNSKRMHIAKHSFAKKHKDWLVLYQREALEQLARKIFSLDEKICTLKLNINSLVTRVSIIEETIKKVKSMPIIRQLFYIKSKIFRG